MKVKLLVSVSGALGAFDPGDEYPCASNEEAIRMIEAGYAVPVAEPIERAVKAAPEKRKK